MKPRRHIPLRYRLGFDYAPAVSCFALFVFFIGGSAAIYFLAPAWVSSCVIAVGTICPIIYALAIRKRGRR